MSAPDFSPLPRPYKIPSEAGPARFGLIVASIHHYLNIHPWWRHHEPHEAQAVLWSLGYADERLPEDEVEAALQLTRIPFRQRAV